MRYVCLLPAGSEEYDVLQTATIHVAIVPSCQLLYNTIHLAKIETPKRQYSGHNIPLGHHTDCGPLGLVQYHTYCGPHTASSVFLILLLLRTVFLPAGDEFDHGGEQGQAVLEELGRLLVVVYGPTYPREVLSQTVHHTYTHDVTAMKT